MINSKKIAIIGLGYVGLPLTIEFSKKYNLVGFDKNKKRIKELISGIDSTKEIKIKKNKNIFFTSDEKKLADCNVFIITVPTPVDKNKKPDLRSLINATKIISKYIKHKDIIIYESTVHPGATDQLCIPLIEKISKIKCKNNQDKLNKYFFCGYSPERINPGDKKHTLKNITKLISCNSKAGLINIKKLYESIGLNTFSLENIKQAESAKIIENVQRDLNIALINELSDIFFKMNIDTYKVLEAASTKWNFLNFEPGLVGGHCIGVDPYYLTHATQKLGYKAKLILSGRKINNNVPFQIFSRLKKKLREKKIYNKKNKILIMGFTFKENCTDVRNSKVYDLYKLLKKNNSVDIYDPLVDIFELGKLYNLKKINKLKRSYYDVIIISVKHKIFKNIGLNKIIKSLKSKSILFDVKNLFNHDKRVDMTL